MCMPSRSAVKSGPPSAVTGVRDRLRGSTITHPHASPAPSRRVATVACGVRLSRGCSGGARGRPVPPARRRRRGTTGLRDTSSCRPLPILERRRTLRVRRSRSRCTGVCPARGWRDRRGHTARPHARSSAPRRQGPVRRRRSQRDRTRHARDRTARRDSRPPCSAPPCRDRSGRRTVACRMHHRRRAARSVLRCTRAERRSGRRGSSRPRDVGRRSVRMRRSASRRTPRSGSRRRGGKERRR